MVVHNFNLTVLSEYIDLGEGDCEIFDHHYCSPLKSGKAPVSLVTPTLMPLYAHEVVK